LLPHSVSSNHAAVLLIDDNDDAAQPVKHWLRDTLPAAHITHCRSFAAAQDFLGAAAVDLILARNVLPDGTGMDVLHYVRDHQISAPVVVQAHDLAEGSETALRNAGALDVACTPRPADQIARLRLIFGIGSSGDGSTGVPQLAAATGEIDHLRGLVRALCTEVGRVTHDVNNPVTTISGNAQFLVELGKMSGMDEVMLKAAEDIQAATQQLTAELEKLTRLKEHLRQHVGHQEMLLS
jgi:CheY-like chemotaxis protein